MTKKTDKKQTETKDRTFDVLNLIANIFGLVLLFVFVFVASLLLMAYFNTQGGFDIVGLWRGFYAAL